MKNQLDPDDQLSYVALDLFTPEECNKIIKYMLKTYELVPAGTQGGSRGEKSSLGGEVLARDSKVSWIPHEDAKAFWFKDRLKKLMLDVNSVKYKFDISWAQKIQFTKYSCEEYYSWHCDAGKNDPSNKRKLSVTVLLSDPSKYNGGELVLLTHGSNYHTVKLEQGQVAIFNSMTPHMVTPVEAPPGKK